MADKRHSDGAAEREELLDELEENHERARREAAGHPDVVDEREAKPTERDEKDPSPGTTGRASSPRFGEGGRSGAEYGGPLEEN